MPQPLVSVIVPAYNAAGFISRCVESITSQSYPELEILLLNDGSTDDTLAVCRKLAAADSRIRVVDKPNTGAADTRSCGLALAHGEYIQFADSDDHLLPGCTANLVAAMQRSHADLVLAPYRMMVPRKDGGYDTREYSLLPAGCTTRWITCGSSPAMPLPFTTACSGTSSTAGISSRWRTSGSSMWYTPRTSCSTPGICRWHSGLPPSTKPPTATSRTRRAYAIRR